jgi:hypothetical protein
VYTLWSSAKYAEVAKSFPEDQRQLPVVARALGKMWKEMHADEKAQWYEKAGVKPKGGKEAPLSAA